MIGETLKGLRTPGTPDHTWAAARGLTPCPRLRCSLPLFQQQDRGLLQGKLWQFALLFVGGVWGEAGLVQRGHFKLPLPSGFRARRSWATLAAGGFLNLMKTGFLTDGIFFFAMAAGSLVFSSRQPLCMVRMPVSYPFVPPLNPSTCISFSSRQFCKLPLTLCALQAASSASEQD